MRRGRGVKRQGTEGRAQGLWQEREEKGKKGIQTEERLGVVLEKIERPGGTQRKQGQGRCRKQEHWGETELAGGYNGWGTSPGIKWGGGEEDKRLGVSN